MSEFFKFMWSIHTVEVTGSNPVSPTTPFPMRIEVKKKRGN